MAKPIAAIMLDANTVEAAGQVRRHRQPVYDLARALIREGHDPDTILATRWEHGTAAFKPAPLRVFAKWTEYERDKKGLGLEPHRELPQEVRGRLQDGDLGREAA